MTVRGMDEQKNKGFVILHRALLDWEWYSDPNTARLFIHLILTVNHASGQWHGIEIERGQRVSSYAKLASETGLSVKEVRTALNHLKKTGEVAHKASSKYGLFTVVNYDKYQAQGTQEGTLSAVRGQSRGSQRATNNNENNENNKNNEKISPKAPSKGAKKDWPGFDSFYAAYPRHTGKAAALKAWNKLEPNQALQHQMLEALKKQKRLPQWADDNGRFIPHPATWLNGHRWEDETEVKKIEDESIGQYAHLGITV